MEQLEKKDFISVIIPVFNQSKKITKTLKSLLGQTIKNFEIIIVNDGSHDNVEDVVSNFLKKNNFLVEVKFFNQENGGASAARNKGFRESKGNYLFFCDADTILLADTLEIMLSELKKHPEAGYVYSSFMWGRKMFKLFPFSAEKLRQMPYINTMSLIRRNVFPAEGWDESIKKFQDWDLWLTILGKGHRGYWIDKVLFTVSTGGTISSWLPSFFYKLMPFLPSVKKYKKAMIIIKNKHGLV